MEIFNAEDLKVLARSAAFLVVLLVLWGVTVRTVRMRRIGIGKRAEVGMRIREAINIGREQRLVVVEWGDRQWMLATSSRGVQVLSEKGVAEQKTTREASGHPHISEVRASTTTLLPFHLASGETYEA